MTQPTKEQRLLLPPTGVSWEAGTTFPLTEELIALLRRGNVDFNDDAYEGAAGLDLKRPYGNSDVLTDVAEIVYGDRLISQDDENFFLIQPLSDRDPGTEAQLVSRVSDTVLRQLHRATGTALAIVLSTGSFQPGVYRRTRSYSDAWEYVGPIEPEAAE